ncbi:multiple epidermal growth factor-like domains protein 10 [Haliotis rubra]|uniref:multiple epidermal growth factor-like domains protein 10 n=1 Tax=Haliotis rubra TaxID=36100 RepID=UPI001EE54175|nr:multiple epidermal growth factor-like domains protein 10 [Haliotis rubra]
MLRKRCQANPGVAERHGPSVSEHCFWISSDNRDAMACHMLLLVLVGLSSVSYMAGGCPNCFKGCDENGQCDEYGCLAGYYGKNCSLLCPPNCRDGVLKKPVCDRDTALCLSGCRQGFFGNRCDQHCPSKCVDKTCVQMDGNCIGGCEAHWHGVNCTKQCNTTCYNSTCDRSGLCDSCKTGFWGFFCENTCSQHCLNNTCEVSTDGSFVCSHGCQKGWKGARCQEPSLQHTRTRRDDSDCYVKVVDGACSCCKRNTGDMCQIDCPKCRTRYQNSKCDRFCETGYYNGTNGKCDSPCGEHCALDANNTRSCNPLDGSCHSCENGYRGNQCKFECSPYCLNKTCAIHSAYCLYCSNVTYGNHCQECSQYCLDKYCHRWNGTCKTGCAKGRYGYMCSDECPKNCYKSNCSLSIYGSVSCTECKNGFTGFSCEERCPVNCTVCRQLDAKCRDGDSKRGWTKANVALGIVVGVLLIAVAAHSIASLEEMAVLQTYV